jgi:hypothetical protein
MCSIIALGQLKATRDYVRSVSGLAFLPALTDVLMGEAPLQRLEALGIVLT